MSVGQCKDSCVRRKWRLTLLALVGCLALFAFVVAANKHRTGHLVLSYNPAWTVGHVKVTTTGAEWHLYAFGPIQAWVCYDARKSEVEGEQR